MEDPMKKIKTQICNIPADMLSYISGGNGQEFTSPGYFAIQNVTVTPNIGGNNNVTFGNVNIAYPVTDYVGVYANTVVVTDYNTVVNPNNSVGIYGNIPF